MGCMGPVIFRASTAQALISFFCLLRRLGTYFTYAFIISRRVNTHGWNRCHASLISEYSSVQASATLSVLTLMFRVTFHISRMFRLTIS